MPIMIIDMPIIVSMMPIICLSMPILFCLPILYFSIMLIYANYTDFAYICVYKVTILMTAVYSTYLYK